MWSIVCEWIEYDVSEYLRVEKNICKESVCDSASVFAHVFVHGKASNLVGNLRGNGAQAHIVSYRLANGIHTHFALL